MARGSLIRVQNVFPQQQIKKKKCKEISMAIELEGFHSIYI